jgi:hypothetical protein
MIRLISLEESPTHKKRNKSFSEGIAVTAKKFTLIEAYPHLSSNH